MTSWLSPSQPMTSLYSCSFDPINSAFNRTSCWTKSIGILFDNQQERCNQGNCQHCMPHPKTVRAGQPGGAICLGCFLTSTSFSQNVPWNCHLTIKNGNCMQLLVCMMSLNSSWKTSPDKIHVYTYCRIRHFSGCAAGPWAMQCRDGLLTFNAEDRSEGAYVRGKAFNFCTYIKQLSKLGTVCLYSHWDFLLHAKIEYRMTF